MHRALNGCHPPACRAANRSHALLYLVFVEKTLDLRRHSSSRCGRISIMDVLPKDRVPSPGDTRPAVQRRELRQAVEAVQRRLHETRRPCACGERLSNHHEAEKRAGPSYALLHDQSRKRTRWRQKQRACFFWNPHRSQVTGVPRDQHPVLIPLTQKLPFRFRRIPLKNSLAQKSTQH